jgi:hypothetical protein
VRVTETESGAVEALTGLWGLAKLNPDEQVAAAAAWRWGVTAASAQSRASGS